MIAEQEFCYYKHQKVGHMMSEEVRVFICIGIAFLVFLCASIILGPERKALWFKKRTKYTFFSRRSVFGEIMHFGYPVTKEGYAVTSIIIAAIGVATYVVYQL